MVDFTCKFPLGYSKGARFKYELYICSFCAYRKFWANQRKIVESSLTLENFDFGSRFTNYGVHFVYKFCSF